MAIPHTADQPMWNEFIHDLGVGPKGISIDKLNKDILKTKLLDLYYNESYKSKAEHVSKQMQAEDYYAELYEFITH